MKDATIYFRRASFLQYLLKVLAGLLKAEGETAQ